MTIVVTAILITSAALQLAAAILALRAIPYSGAYRYPWIALSLALVLMVERRVEPIFDGPPDLADALYALVISVLIAFGLMGLERLLRALWTSREELTRLAITDPLTGLANRRRLFAELESGLRRADRSRQRLSVLMLDLDHFKRLNDRHGHAVGDAVLATAAARFRARLRATDTCGRLGGEEFAVVLPDTDADGAAALAEGLRADVATAMAPAQAGCAITVTISIGVATWTPPARERGSTAAIDAVAESESLLRRADAALYRAKAEGRDRVRGEDASVPVATPGNTPA